MSTKLSLTPNAKKSRNIWLFFICAALVILGIVIVGAMAQNNRLAAAENTVNKGTTSTTGSENAATADLTLERRIKNDPLARGSVDAPVVMIEYSDFSCPFCGVYARKTQPEIIQKYVQSGQLRIEWRDLPVLGEQSVRAAVAGRAAAEQGKFWEFNEALYAAAPERGKAVLSETALMKLAQKAGVPDMSQFTQDLKRPDLLAQVNADLAEGTQLGLNSTPTFVINNQAIPGAQPLETFVQIIDEALALVQ